METQDFERLKESVRQMVAVKKDVSVRHRVMRYSGKVLIEIQEDGTTVWSLDEAAEELTGRLSGFNIETPHEFVKTVRESLNQTQEGFAELLGVPIGTLRGWEQGRRIPRGPAKTLLNITARNPQALIEANRSKFEQMI